MDLPKWYGSQAAVYEMAKHMCTAAPWETAVPRNA